MALTESDKIFIGISIENGILKALDQHAKNCPVVRDYYGNGKTGTKTEVHDLKQDIKTLKAARSGQRQFVTQVASGVVTGVVLFAVLIFLGWRSPAKQEAAPPTDLKTEDSGLRTEQ